MLLNLTIKTTLINTFRKVYQFFIIVISMAGYVPKNATLTRTVALVSSLIFAVYLGYFDPYNSRLAVFYFLVSEIFYIGFLMVVLSENGLRHWLMRKYGDEEGYLTYEGILGFLFFHNATGIGYIASSSPGDLFNFIHEDILLTTVLIMFIGGFMIKILAAKAVTIEIYYLKDMFFGKKISDFVVSGPYRFFKNPMYGIGQMQAYATAIWYGSEYGLAAAILNQVLIFSFYYLFEKKFIKRVYLNNKT